MNPKGSIASSIMKIAIFAMAFTIYIFLFPMISSIVGVFFASNSDPILKFFIGLIPFAIIVGMGIYWFDRADSGGEEF